MWESWHLCALGFIRSIAHTLISYNFRMNKMSEIIELIVYPDIGTKPCVTHARTHARTYARLQSHRVNCSTTLHSGTME